MSKKKQAIVTGPRKPPKRVTSKVKIGTLNVLTGKVRSRWPDAIIVPPRAYDELRAIVAWLEAAPPKIEPDEELYERCANRVADFINMNDWPNLYVASVQIETERTKQRNTHVGAFVALLEDDESIDAGEIEHHCYIQRGKRG